MSKLVPSEPVVHEAEIHRQHVRLKVPIRAEIAGEWYQVDDWSLGGIGIEAEPPRAQEGDILPVLLAMPFEDFELRLGLEVELIYRLPDRPRFGCRFTGMTRGQISLFRQVIDRYLAGEIASPGDVLVALGRESFQPARVETIEGGGGGAGRALGWAGAALVGLALVGLVGFGAYQRFYRIRTTDAWVEAPVYRVNAPVAGQLEYFPIGQIMEPNTPIARVISGLDRTEYDLRSPCLCSLGKWQVEDGAGIAAGATAAILVSADVPLKVTALLPLDQAEQLTVGAPVRLQVAGEPDSRTGQIERIAYAAPIEDLAKSRGPGAGTRTRIPVTIRPDEPLNYDLLGVPVTVDLR